MRHWHWLGVVMTIAQAAEAKDLDNPDRKRRLSRGLTIGRRFESIQVDGYNPDRIEATKTLSLYKHVLKRPAYGAAAQGYEHPFWSLLIDRNTHVAKDDNTFHRLLRAHGLARLEPIDESHGAMLGLITENDYERVDYSKDEEATPYDLDLIIKEPSLDSLQLLLLLYREAQDFAIDGQTRALRRAIEFAADRFAEAYRYTGEHLDTWHCLVHTRMIRWNPMFEPSQQALKQAQEALIKERDAAEKRKGRRGPSPPETYTHVRAERRWRRQIWAKACHLSFAQPQMPAKPLQPWHVYVDTALADWLIANQSMLVQHNQQALALLMDSNPEASNEQSRNPGNLPPLVMPDHLYRRRVRPRSDEMTWHLFGDHLPFDVIAVAEASDE